MSTYAKLPTGGGGGGGGVATITSPIVDVSGTSAITLAYKPVQYVVQTGVTATIDFSLAPSAWVDLAGDCAFTFTNTVNGGSYILGVAQNSTPQVISFTTPVLWGPQGAPDITGLAHDEFIIINIFVDYYNRLVGSYYMGYAP